MEVIYSSVYFVSAFLVLVVTTVLYMINKYTYWSQKGVKQVTPVPFLGNFTDYVLQKRSMGDVSNEIYNQFPSLPYVGAYFLNNSLLILRDIDLIKCVLTKDFNHFNNRGLNFDKMNRFVTTNIFNNEGDEWKIWRQNMSPVFTTSKLKKMIHLLVQCSNNLISDLDKKLMDNDTLEIREVIAGFTIEGIGAFAFGLQPHEKSEVNDAFRAIGRRTFKTSVTKSMKDTLGFMYPKAYHSLGFKSISVMEENFFLNFYREVSKSRQGKHATQNDLTDLLMRIRSHGYVDGDSLGNPTIIKRSLEVEDVDIAAQMFTIFAGGHDTTKSSISYTLYLLAKNRQVQDRVRDEIKSRLQETNGEITYELLQNMNYLDMVMDETLRLYPLLMILNRQCTSKYTLPGTDLVIDKGVDIHIPVMAIHLDPQYYPNPEEFNPDNFLPEVVAARNPYTYMPFGEGPRICIGLRFAKLKMKIGLIAILNRYDIIKTDQTAEKLRFNPKNLLTEPLGGIYLKLMPLAATH